ncbi:MAG: hypothetical protein Ta2A_24360 [Treponemataceae bacterium]|nr:MAG: hypothetical protein Ta2A_24360 [Treponemataceae bacterium]
MGLSMSVKKAVTQEICVRYRRAERKDKRRILAATSLRSKLCHWLWRLDASKRSVHRAAHTDILDR